LELFRRRYGEDHVGVATSFRLLGQLYHLGGERDRADVMYHEAIGRSRKLHEPQALAIVLVEYGEVILNRGEYAEAEPLLRESLELERQSLGEDHFAIRRVRDDLARLYKAWGKPDPSQ